MPGHSRQTLQRWALGGVGALGLTALVTLAGCPANLDNPERFADGGNAPPGDNLPPCLAKLFNKDPLVGKCAGGGCHNQNNIGYGGDLDLASPGVASRLINVSATHAGSGDAGACMPAKLIDTANPAASWLLVKINGMEDMVNCGGTMPQVGTLTSTEKACITSYVMAVAADAGAAMATGGTGGMSSGGSGGSTAIAGTGGAPAAGGSGGSGGAAMGGSGGAAMGGGSSGGSGGASGGASGSAGTGGT